ncbi:MAG: nucleotidyltransferase domain-containing protein [Chloroflexota bacterium]|nr:nucleotidyltransferase domain-containing protein [Chloroflexota bacterium]MDE2948695.1 nucleotidyltransferase domain-containing protein [Chloroflexota bacterium]
MNPESAIDLPLDDIRKYCKRQPIRRLSVFGSAIRGNMRPDSDIDLLVEYRVEAKVGMEFFQHMVDLGKIIGREVDLRTPQDLSRYFRQAICEEAIPIFENE